MGTTQSERARSQGQAGKVRNHRQAVGKKPSPPRRKKAFALTAPEPKEDQLQVSVASLFDVIFSEDIAWSHFPAGGYYLTKAAQARLYRLGLKRGWPDLLIVYPHGTLWIELKTHHGSLTDAQRSRHNQLRSLGHAVVICRSVEDVVAALKTYRVPFRRHRIGGVQHGNETTEGSRSAQLAQSTGT